MHPNLDKHTFICLHFLMQTVYSIPSVSNVSSVSNGLLLLWIIYVISVLCLLCFRARLFIAALWSPAGKGLSFVMSNCEFCHFPIGILGQVWYLTLSIPDLCTLSYFVQ